MPFHYAGDEAGDVAFAFTQGASRHFVIALIRTTEPETLRPHPLTPCAKTSQVSEMWKVWGCTNTTAQQRNHRTCP